MTLSERLTGNPQGEAHLGPINLGPDLVFGPKNPYNLPTMADVSPESLQPQITLETAAKYMAQNLPGLIGGAVEILNQRVQDLRSKFSPKNAKTLLSEMLIVSMLASGCGFSNSTPEPTPVSPAPTPRVEPVPSPTVIPSPIPMPTIFPTPTPEKPPLTPTIVTPGEMILGAGVGPLTPEQTITYTQIISDIKAWGIQAQTGGVLSTTRELDANGQSVFNLTLQTTDARFAAWDQNKKIFVFLAAPQIGKLEWGGLAGMLVKDQQGNIISRYAFNQAKGAWELIVAPTPEPTKVPLTATKVPETATPVPATPTKEIPPTPTQVLATPTTKPTQAPIPPGPGGIEAYYNCPGGCDQAVLAEALTYPYTVVDKAKYQNIYGQNLEKIENLVGSRIQNTVFFRNGEAQRVFINYVKIVNVVRLEKTPGSNVPFATIKVNLGNISVLLTYILDFDSLTGEEKANYQSWYGLNSAQSGVYHVLNSDGTIDFHASVNTKINPKYLTPGKVIGFGCPEAAWQAFKGGRQIYVSNLSVFE